MTTMTETTETVALVQRMARIENGQEQMPVQGSYMVLDPLHLEALRQKVAKISARCVKRGALPITLWEAPEATWVERPRTDGTIARIRVRQVAVLGDVPDTGAWQYVAVLRHLPSGTVIQATRHASDDDIATYRARGPVCEHCEFRRARHDTYVIRNRETGATIQVGGTCLEAYIGLSCDAAVYAFDMHKSLCDEISAHGKLDDAVRAEDGTPVLDALAGLLGGDYVVAGTILGEATRKLLPSLVEERRMEVSRLAGVETAWDETIARLPGALHNATVILAEGYVSPRNRFALLDLKRWYQTEADRLTRETLATDETAQMTALGLTTLPSTPLALAALLADPVAVSAARKLLAALAPASPAAPVNLGVSGQDPERGDIVNLPGGTAGRVFWRGNNRYNGETIGVCTHNCKRCNDPKWIPMSQVRAW